MSTSEKSVRSKSTTQQTGDLYTKGFSKGFLAQNVNFLEDGSWLGSEIQIRSNKRNRRCEKPIADLGDIDFLCRTKFEVPVQQLFPATARCDTDSFTTIPVDWDLYIEVTSMAGELAIKESDGPSKVDKKISFYERLFNDTSFADQLPQGVQINKVNKVVFFVYNGADYVDLKRKFKSEKFHAIVVHLPFEFCLSWETDVELKKMRNALEENEILLEEKKILLEEKILLVEKEIALQAALQETIKLQMTLSASKGDTK